MNEIAEAFHRVLAHVMRTKNDSGPYWTEFAGGCWNTYQMDEDKALLSKLIDQKCPWADEPVKP